ncbi:MAG: hypothetical protein HYT70_02550 [Candidatus Aenigmarchaeota archaeon]|nr:hypothetical protein [Candidatus Aenigmarchaeota archaeon]
MNFQFLPLIAVVAIVSFVAGFALFSAPLGSVGTEGDGTTALEYHAVQCTYIQRAGETEWTQWDCNPNLFNDDGMNATLAALTFQGETLSPIDDIALSNKSGGPGGNQCIPAQDHANTFLCGEYDHSGLARASGTVRLNQTGAASAVGNWSVTAEFTNTGSGALDVNATGLFNTTTVNQTREIFFAQNTFTTATLQINDKINVTWFIWVV